MTRNKNAVDSGISVPAMGKAEYRATLRALQIELVKLQKHFIRCDDKILVLLEGRDAAGKDGTIKRIVEHLSPRETRVVALGKPSDRDRTAWYFQRYVTYLPAAQEFVLFNRSWYNRAGVERVMGFCTDAEYEEFMETVLDFEHMLVRCGIKLLKYYLDISRQEQKKRLQDRRDSPLKRWKISPIDAQARKHWDAYSHARNAMLARTHNPVTPWTVVRADDKHQARQARRNLIKDLLSRLHYGDKDPALLLTNPATVVQYEESYNPQWHDLGLSRGCERPPHTIDPQGTPMTIETPPVIWFEALARGDVAHVGGKNASLGEMVGGLAAQGVKVPPGFATTAATYWGFVAANGLKEVIAATFADLDSGKVPLAEAGQTIRRAFVRGDWPPATATASTAPYRELCRRIGRTDADVAVRSSATAEDLPDASFAGQQETYLNIRGERALLDACRRCYASLFTDRAISYRQAKGFDHLQVALSVGVQRMVRSDVGGAGVMFSIDTETGFDKVVLIDAAWGLGENVVQGAVDPDAYQVFKPLLADASLTPIIEKKRGEKALKMIYASGGERPTRNVPTSKAERAAFVLDDGEILALARWACVIEQHYGQPMDMEWAKDGETGELFIVQARPETVQSRREASALKTYRILRKGRQLVAGMSIGEAVVAGKVCVIDSAKDIDRFVEGAVLVTATTDPDWVPIMKRAAAIVTDHGGRTSHAAIVSRELGLPAIVGAGNATHLLHDEQVVTVSCAEGDQGFVYEGTADFAAEELDLSAIPATRTKVMLNLANPAAALRWWRLPADGVGLARMEFVVNNHIKVHPMALVRYDALEDQQAKQAIAALTLGYADKTEYFVDRLARALGRIAAAHHPNPIIVRMSDFKTNEYAHLIGGAAFEPHEENPMLGFRGASRYYSPRYREGFALECRAIRRLRQEMGFANVVVMIPFCRSPKEADRVLAVMAENGLTRGEDGLEVYVMCEIPSNVILAKAFAARFDGFSIGSNDLTQLTLGVDRDSEELAELFDEQDEAVKWMIREVITQAHQAGAKVGLCGQAPSNHPAFAEFLVACGIDSLSVTPDSFLAVKRHVAAAEAAQAGAEGQAEP